MGEKHQRKSRAICWLLWPVFFLPRDFFCREKTRKKRQKFQNFEKSPRKQSKCPWSFFVCLWQRKIPVSKIPKKCPRSRKVPVTILKSKSFTGMKKFHEKKNTDLDGGMMDNSMVGCQKKISGFGSMWTKGPTCLRTSFAPLVITTICQCSDCLKRNTRKICN